MFKGKINALKTRAPLTWQKIRAILQLGRKAELRLFLPLKFEYFIIEKLNLQKKSHTAEKTNPNVSPIRKKFGFAFFGDPSAIRTRDTLIKSQVLCQLS